MIPPASQLEDPIRAHIRGLGRDLKACNLFNILLDEILRLSLLHVPQTRNDNLKRCLTPQKFSCYVNSWRGLLRVAFSPIQGFLSARFFLVLFKRTHALFLRGSNSFTRASNSLYPARMWCAERSRVSWLFRVNPDSLPAVNLAITKSTRRNQANRSQPIISQEISLRSRVWKFYSINSWPLQAGAHNNELIPSQFLQPTHVSKPVSGRTKIPHSYF